MNKINELILTPEFWFVAVFVGLLVNIAATYVRKLIEIAFLRANKRWDARNEKAQLKRDMALAKYSASYQQFCLGKLELNHKKLTAIHEFILAILLLILGIISKDKFDFISVIAGIMALFSIFTGIVTSISHGRFMLLIADAEDILNSQQNSNSQSVS